MTTGDRDILGVGDGLLDVGAHATTEVRFGTADGRVSVAATDVGARLEAVLFEMKRVIAGQDAMLDRILVALLAGGHVLLEGVPGLAKTLTVRTLADVLHGVFHRIQFTPDLVPADLVGTRVYRPDTGKFDTELGPVFCNFLLADEINRAPAKVQSALLEVMQEKQVTIGRETFDVSEPFLVLATQNPIESEGTYPLPEAQIDRFMMKVVVDYPTPDDELTVVQRSLDPPDAVRRVLSIDELVDLQSMAARVYVDRQVAAYAVRLAAVTRDAEAHGVSDVAPFVEYGASPRGPINLVHAAQAAALMRGRDYVLPVDVTELVKDVFRHRMVPSYRALAEGVGADEVLDRVMEAVPVPHIELAGSVAGV